GVGRFRQILRAILFSDVFANFGQGFRRDARGIGTHVGDETDGAFFTEFHAFIKTLSDHHGALDAEAQLAGRVLLQFAGRERRSRIAAAFFFVGRTDYPVRFFQSGTDLFRFLTIANLNLFLAFTQEPSIEGWRFRGRKVGVNGPVFILL